MAARFFWRGNDLGLDLVNTEAVDEGGAPLDLLPDVDALIEWAGDAGVADAETAGACRRLPRRSAGGLLDWVHRLRSATRALVEPGAGRSDEAAAQAFSALVGEIPVRLVWPGSSGGTPPWTPVGAANPADRLRLALALVAMQTLRLDPARIRRCEGERCVLLYYDSSRNRSRRWCDMASCGNRAKAAAHYRRRKHQNPLPEG